MQEIKRLSKRTGGDIFEIRDSVHLLRTLESHSKSWGLLLETPLGLYNPQYNVDLRKGGTRKNRLTKVGTPEKFNIQIAKIVGITATEYPSEVKSVKVDLRPSADMSNIIARIVSVDTEDGSVEFDFPFTANCLTFTKEFKSKLWLHHLDNLLQRDPFVYLQAAKRISSFCQQVSVYKEEIKKVTESLENNLLLLSRFWEWLGIDLGLHVTRFPDHPYSMITMTGHGRLQRGVELKYYSKGYNGQSSFKKRQNPFTVLKGQLIINFKKVPNPKTIMKTDLGADITDLIIQSIEGIIAKQNGASIEEINNELIIRGLELGFLDVLSKKYADLTPFLLANFDYHEETDTYHLKKNIKFKAQIPLEVRIKYYLVSMMRRLNREGKYPHFDEIILEIMPLLRNGVTPEAQTISTVLDEVATRVGEDQWKLKEEGQGQLFDVI